MGTMILDFADQLYSFMALKYEIAPPKVAAVGGPPIEDWPSDEFTVDIARAVMMLSYAYRSSYRRHFQSVATMLFTSRDNPKLYAIIFAKVTYRFHCPLKIFILCSFISEMYLFIFYRKGAEDERRHYISPAMECFNCVYKAVLSKIDDPILKWDDVKHAAFLLTRGYDSFEPIMLTEHPSSESKDFFNSVKDVLQGPSREGASKWSGSSASAPSTPPAYKRTLADKRRLEKLLEAGALADQLEQTSLTKRDSPSGDEKPKSRGRKSSARPHKTRACGKSAESTSQATASTSTAEPLDVKHYLISMGKNTTQHEATNKPVATNISPAFREVSAASQRVPGVGEEVRLYQVRNNQATNESPNDSDNTMPVETCANSSAAKKKSKKNKKKKKGKK
ncbi:hypothetical protein JTE90_026338 [Oedothorax gibbosus]|uniref:Uncharacterized protein n=1 Tax=Oedothorax gibbosus TaxID=931172 RepID=A0AAV6U5M9_9ARAC|nr:hypothetical protein JTE90_026338 [Oedothorax gibbosus]